MSIPEFVEQLQSKYQTALSNQTLFFTPTTIIHLNSSSGIQFEIRCVTSLSAKPTANQQTSTNALEQNQDPFAPPYIPDLFVCAFNIDENQDSDSVETNSYVILLNKFCVVPRHFLLVTQAFKSQNTPPSPSDLYTIQSVLDQVVTCEPQNEWIAFYNSGPESGASQSHKHFQFIPIKKGTSPFGKLIEQCAPTREGEIFSLPGLPYSHFIALLPPLVSFSTDTREEIEIALGRVFMGLLDSMIDRLRHLPPSSDLDSSKNQHISYNLVITQKYMILVPRSKEKFEGQMEKQIDDNNNQFKISINSLGAAAGMILVKSMDSLERLKQIGIDDVLASVTFPDLKDVIDPDSQ